jgi:hypothetical protein
MADKSEPTWPGALDKFGGLLLTVGGIWAGIAASLGSGSGHRGDDAVWLTVGIVIAVFGVILLSIGIVGGLVTRGAGKKVEPSTAQSQPDGAPGTAASAPEESGIASPAIGSIGLRALPTEFTAEEKTWHGHRFQGQTLVFVGVRNGDVDAEFTAQARLLPAQARRMYPEQELPPPAFHDVAWDHTVEERAQIGKDTSKKLIVMWTFVEPHGFWFRVPKNSSWNPDGYGSGWALRPAGRTVDFELWVTNQRTGESAVATFRVTFTEESHLVEAFDLMGEVMMR